MHCQLFIKGGVYFCQGDDSLCLSLKIHYNNNDLLQQQGFVAQSKDFVALDCCNKNTFVVKVVGLLSRSIFSNKTKVFFP